MNGIDPLDTIAVACPMCYGDVSLSLGMLGVRQWFRCVACGAEYSLRDHEDRPQLLGAIERDLEAAGYRTFPRDDGFVVLVGFETAGSREYALQWQVRRLGDQATVRKILDDREFPAPPAAAGILDTILEVEQADARAAWPESTFGRVWHVVKLVHTTLFGAGKGGNL